MTNNLIGSDIVVQVGVIVADVEAASRAWARLLGVEVPAWRMTDTQEVSHIRYRGQSTDARAKLAFFNLGQVSLELIEPVDEPSTWREFLDQHGQGLHHIAFRLKGMDEAILRLEGEGMRLVQRGDYKGGRYAYLDGVSQFGAILELLEDFGRT